MVLRWTPLQIFTNHTKTSTKHSNLLSRTCKSPPWSPLVFSESPRSSSFVNYWGEWVKRSEKLIGACGARRAWDRSIHMDRIGRSSAWNRSDKFWSLRMSLQFTAFLLSSGSVDPQTMDRSIYVLCDQYFSFGPLFGPSCFWINPECVLFLQAI